MGTALTRTAVTARRDTDPMTTRAYWLIRYSGFAVVGITALLSPPHQPHQELYRGIQIGCFAAAGLALLGWLLVDEFPRYRRRGLPIALGLLAAASGLAAVTSGGGQSLVAFAAVAAVAAGAETEWPQAIAITAAGIAPIWIVGPIVGATLGTLAGYPLLIAATLSLGRNRRSYRIQAEQAAALVEQYERARTEQRRADVLDERARIAREIHDVLAHSLGALGIQIQAAKAVLTDHHDIDRAVEALTTAQRMAADGLTETRRAVHALRVDTLPLGDELAAVVDTHRQRYQVPVTFERAGAARPLPPDASLALLRTGQEALVNAAKHAPGEPITVRLAYGDHDVSLTVANHRNGAGPAAAGPSSAGGYGLTGMRERLRLLDGTLLAGPGETLGGEWTVTAELPLASNDMTPGSQPPWSASSGSDASPDSAASPGSSGR
jgi:signal transduction histidine kinase